MGKAAFGAGAQTQRLTATAESRERRSGVREAKAAATKAPVPSRSKWRWEPSWRTSNTGLKHKVVSLGLHKDLHKVVSRLNGSLRP